MLEILDIANEGAKKTQIVYGANLNSSIAKKYIDTLKEKNLIEQRENLFITTDKGKHYQEMAKELQLGPM